MSVFSDVTFTFVSYTFDPQTGTVRLRYDLDGIALEETLTIPGAPFPSPLPADVDRALFLLHLMGGIGYWKTRCAKHIVIQSGQLTRTQAHFWETVYTNGLGEFYVVNQIDFRDQVHFPYHTNLADPVLEPAQSVPAVLVPFGGGKDSIVTAELLRTAGLAITLLSVQQATAIQETARVFGAPLLVLDRHLDPQLTDPTSALRGPGTFQGHVPISGIWAAMTVVAGLLRGASDVVFSWERSASEGNTDYLGMEINHQWSKSLSFERSFQAYLGTFVTQQVRVFSLVRPLSELHIVKLFSAYPQYRRVFSSCNRNFTQQAINNGAPTRWCGRCPKCAFIFSQLCAFIPHQEVVDFVGSDLFAQDDLLDLFRELMGIQGHKPFECVGEAVEVVAAFELARRRGDANHTPAMQLYIHEVLPALNNPDELIQDLLTPTPDHAIPEAFQAVLYDSLGPRA